MIPQRINAVQHQMTAEINNRTTTAKRRKEKGMQREENCDGIAPDGARQISSTGARRCSEHVCAEF